MAGKPQPPKNEAYFIDRFGEHEGKRKYREYFKRTEAAAARALNNVDDGQRVTCQMCGKQMKRITGTHLAKKCKEPMTVEEYQARFPDSPIITDSLRGKYSLTEKSLIQRYGEELGKQRWKEYCDKQAETNTFEYKQAAHGMTKEEFDEYNKSRSCTVENFIQRHGEEEGQRRWQEYCDRQRYTTTLEYFVETYGEDEGRTKWEGFQHGRTIVNRTQSLVEAQCYEYLKNSIPELESAICLGNMHGGPYDFGSKPKKKLIEFYGSYWHADPAVFSDSDPRVTADELERRTRIRARDAKKRQIAIDMGYDVYVIWENEWRTNPVDVATKVGKFWNE